MEIPHGALKIGCEIGKGAFGRVFSATAIGISGKPNPTIVAVKQLKRKLIISFSIMFKYSMMGTKYSFYLIPVFINNKACLFFI